MVHTSDKAVDDQARWRDARRRLLMTRQTAIFGWTVLLMALTLVVAIPFALGMISLPFGNTFTLSAKAEAKVPPCTPAGSPVPLQDIKASVLNASSQAGLARETANRLESYGVDILTVGNAEDSYAGSVRIATGKEGVAQAFSLARVLPDADIRLDLSLGNRVNVLLGEQFMGALEADNVAESDLGKMPKSPKECQVIK